MSAIAIIRYKRVRYIGVFLWEFDHDSAGSSKKNWLLWVVESSTIWHVRYKQVWLYIRDTNDFWNKINNFKVPEISYLVTMDVKALYTNITKQRRYCCCQMKVRQVYKENRSHRSDDNILSTYFNTKLFHF